MVNVVPLALMVNIYIYYMVDEQMKVLRSPDNTSYPVTGLFD